jgi:hypothetical protein
MAEVDGQIAELAHRSTYELRLAWRQLDRVAPPPQGLSRDLLIRALAHQLQAQSYAGTGRALRCRLQTLTREREKRGASFDPAVVLKTGTTLVRQWRGHTHAVFVRDDGFEYEGQPYRSLSVIAERITGAAGGSKSHLAAALGFALVENGWRVLFTRTTDLVQRLQIARRELALEAAIAKLDKFYLLILDDIAYVTKDQAETSVFFELISARYQR